MATGRGGANQRQPGNPPALPPSLRPGMLQLLPGPLAGAAARLGLRAAGRRAPGAPLARPRAAASVSSAALPAASMTEAQQEFRELALDFAKGELLPHAARWDAEKHFPVDALRHAASLGFGGI